MKIELPYPADVMARYDSLFQYFSRKYQLKQNHLLLEGHKFSLMSVEDIDPLLDELISLGPDNEHFKDERLPYWAEIWPSSIALASYILKNAAEFKGLSAIEVGCGVGLVGLAAKLAGAEVLITDYQPDALRISEMNWLANTGRSPANRLLDWRHPDIGEKYKIILASDVVYEKRFFQPLIHLFHEILEDGGMIYLSEPNRPIAGEFFQLLTAGGFEVQKWPKPVEWENKTYRVDVCKISVV